MPPTLVSLGIADVRALPPKGDGQVGWWDVDPATGSLLGAPERPTPAEGGTAEVAYPLLTISDR